MKDKEIQDMDLISARKAALGWKEDADMWRHMFSDVMKKLKRATSFYPFFYVAGVLTGILGCLIAAQII